MNSVLDLLRVSNYKADESPLYLLTEEEHELFSKKLTDSFSFKFSENAAQDFIEKSRAEVQLPTGLEIVLKKFSGNSNGLGVLLIRNLPVDSINGFDKNTSFSEAVLIKIGNVLGKTYGYEDKRGGALVHNLVPVKEDAEKQLGSGSVELFWHTEDAHNKYNCDFIELFCLRGDPEAKTLASFIDPHSLDPKMLRILSEPNYIVAGDNTYDDSYDHKTPIITFLDNGDYRVTFDPLYTKCLNDKARAALDYLTKYVQENAYYIALESGDLLIVDNRKSVHSRSEYHPRYDGTDRWLQRVISMSKLVPQNQVLQDRPYLIKKQ